MTEIVHTLTREAASNVINEAAENIITQVVNVTSSFFNASTLSQPRPTKVVRTYTFDSTYSDIDKQVFFIKQYFEHQYNEDGSESDYKKFKGAVKVNWDHVRSNNVVTFVEKRKISKVRLRYDLSKEEDCNLFQLNFGCSVDPADANYGVPMNVHDKLMMLTAIKTAGGSVIKAITRGDTYIDRYWDMTTRSLKAKKPATDVIITILSLTVSVCIAVLL